MKKFSRLICAAVAASLVAVAYAIFQQDADIVVTQPLTVIGTEPDIRSITVNDSLTIASGGTVSVTGRTRSYIGLDATGEVVVQSGGKFTLADNLFVGCDGGTGTLSVAANALVDVSAGVLAVAINTSGANRIPATQGTLNVSGTVKAGTLELTGNFPNQGEPRVESGIVNLEAGGVLQFNRIVKNDRATSYITFNGGAVRFVNNTARLTEIGNSCEMHIVAATSAQAIFDTACDYVVINDAAQDSVFTFSGDGTLVKRGTGYLAFRMNPLYNTFDGDIIVEAGVLDLGRPLAQGQTVTVWAGAMFLAHADDDPMAISYLAQRSALYVPTHTVTNLDLVALTAFYDDAIGTPFLSGGQRLVSNITYSASAGTAQHPFRLVGQGGSLEFEETGLEDAFVLLDGSVGAGTFNFFCDRTLTPDTTNRITFLGPVYYGNIGTLTLNGTEFEPLDWRIMAPSGLWTWGQCTVGASGDATLTTDNTMDAQTFSIASNDGSETSHGTLNLLGGTSTFNGQCTIGAGSGHGTLNIENATLIINSDLYLSWGDGVGANNSYRPYRPTGFLNLGPQSRLVCNAITLTPMWPSSWADATLEAMDNVADITLHAGSVLEPYRIAKNDCSVSTVFFNGGTLRARGSNADFFESNWEHATLNLHATSGNMIDIDTQGHRDYQTKRPGKFNLTGAGGLRKRGSGTLGLNPTSSDYLGDTVVDNGTLIFSGPRVIPSGPGFGDVRLTAKASELALGGHPQDVNTLSGPGTVRNDLFRYIRLKLEGPREPATATSTQLAELELYSGEDKINSRITGWNYDDGGGIGDNPLSNAFPSGEEPFRILDGDLNTKWNDFRTAPVNNRNTYIDRAWLRLVFEAPQRVTAYRWFTADDRSGNDPARWRLQGSMDGLQWFDLDARAGYEAPLGRGEPTEMFTITPDSISPRAPLGILAHGTGGTFADHLSPTLREELHLRKLGNGELTVQGPRVEASHITVEDGALRLCPAAAYRFYRFKIEAVRDPSGGSTQISEFELYDDSENVTPKRTALHYDPTGGWGTDLNTNAGPESERADFAVDGNVHTKWNDFRILRPADFDRVWFAIEFPTQQPVTAYRWFTANDSPERDPTAWRLQGSDDSADWVDIDVVTGYQSPTTDRYTPTGMFPVSIANAAAPLPAHTTLELLGGTTLTLDNISQTLGRLSGTGDVTLTGDATLTLNPPEDSTPAFFGSISGQGSLVKHGPGTQLLLGANDFSGNLTVEGGTLETGTVTPYTWFRFSVKRKLDDTQGLPTPTFQISELALYSADNTRRSLGLRFSPSRISTRLEPGECSTPRAHYPNWSFEGADLLFDGSTGTKFCTSYSTPLPGDPDSWYIVLLRLPDGTPEITQYNIATANDSQQFFDRNPTDWTLEASPDGITWSVVDERSGIAYPGQNYAWYNSNVNYTLNTARAASAAASAHGIPATAVVGIADGATLAAGPDVQIGALAIDLAAGAGTLTHLDPLPGGTLYLTNAQGDPQGLLPLTVTAASNAAALGSWEVHVNGAHRPGLRVTYDPLNAKLRITKGGTILMIR